MCIRDRINITLFATLISSMIFFNLSSNSPLYFVPATSKPISRVTTLLSSNISGTSLLTILWANPSAIAVFPTPGSPISIGLFFVLRPRICITRSISFDLPITGSSFPSAAFWVRLLPNSSKVGVLPLFWPLPVLTSAVSPSNLITWVRTLERSSAKFSSTLAATPSPSLINPSKRCSVPI